MESGPLRYFVAVAEELNFGRAAERLGISAPPLSRAIRRLEAELGFTLFERTTHSVSLTPAGTVLLEEARSALDALQAAEQRARRAAAPEPKLVLAVKADGGAGLLDGILARFATDPAARPVAIRLCEWGEQPQLLRQGEVDVALVHEPFDGTGLDAETVVVEPRLAALPAGHPLADQEPLHLADLGIPAGELRRYLASPAGRTLDPPAARRELTGLAQLLTLVELGEVIQLLPESVTARYPRPGVAYRAVADAPPAVLAIAWPQQSRSRATAALVRAATSLTDPVPIPPRQPPVAPGSLGP